MRLSTTITLAVVGLLNGSDAKVQTSGSANLPISKVVEAGNAPLTRELQSVLTEDDVKALFVAWDEALATEDPTKVAQMYDEKGTLLPTLSDRVRTDFLGIRDYFVDFLAKKPRGEILESHIEIGSDYATDIGRYKFCFAVDGSCAEGRYSYFYTPQSDGTWKILHHHSSLMPEGMVAKGESITEQEVKDLFQLWNDALKTGNPATVAKRYAKEGVLLPTMKDDVRSDFAGIEDYFVSFLQNEPTGEIIESHVMTGHNWAQDVGIYEFTFGKTGQKVRGRYSYIYIFEDGEWMISHHHSSVLPESIISAQPITEDEVKGLFTKWNDALQTKDPNQVADLYSKNGNLLPTMSNRHRTDRAGIVDYFVHFLADEPSGEILSGEIMIGTNWAQHAGIYEFTFNTGKKVQARFTYVYIYEDGEWLISQHHSSQMPEKPKLDEAGCRGLFKRWNDALLLKDPDVVAQRYAKEGTLLPTVSDTPRDTYDLIKDYFVKFLAGSPKGEILESFVKLGEGWCSDVGIYEFSFEDGSKVKGRYSYVYIYEDGDWMISHHHSSQMPEEMAAAIDDAKVTAKAEAKKEAKKDSGNSGILWAAGIAVMGAALAVLGAALFGVYNLKAKQADIERDALVVKRGDA